MKNLYEILGLTQEASPQEIKRAYVKLALIEHPDKDGDEELMKLINVAYGTLSDPSKRRKYDADYYAFKVADIDVDAPFVVAGHLAAGKTPPYSEAFKKTHQKLVATYAFHPLKKDSFDEKIQFFKSDHYHFEDQQGCVKFTNDLFTLIRQKEIYAKSKFVPLSIKKLTPIIAIKIFNDFLSGTYYGFELIAIKKYLLGEISALQSGNSKQSILQFYKGILEIVLMTDIDPSEHDKLIFSIKKITEYSKEAPELLLPDIIPLFYNKFFRSLHAYALHMYWNSKQDLFEPEYLNNFDGSQGARDLLESWKNRLSENKNSDNVLQLIQYIKVLFNFEKDRNTSNATEQTADDCRKNAFHFLDWLPTFLYNSSKEIIANVFLQIGMKFQQAARLEMLPAIKMADEQLAVKMYLTAVELANNNTPDIEIYINTHALKYLSNLEFHNPILTENLNALKKRTLLLADIFPFFESYQSNIDLFNQENKMLHLMRRLLNTMVYIHDYNKSHTESIKIEQSAITILYQAYEACLKNWYQEKYNPEIEQKFRLELMDELLFNNGWLFLDVEQNIDSAYIMVDRDEEGWIQPSRSLPFGNDADIIKYKSINGVEINNKTGEINFFLTPWSPNCPESQKVFTQFDLQEILEKNIGGAIFSLDPVDPDKPYHPFNLMRFAPPQLDESEFLNTMLLTDYILKFLTTTQEVQGQYPFEQRSVATLIGHMPEYLRKIITDFHEAPHSGAIHRFWIEAEEITVPLSEQNNQDMIRIGVNDLKMVVKKHKMVRDIHGNLQDISNDDEGWPVYVLTNEQIQELEQGIRIINDSAMIFTHGQAKLIYWENNEAIHRHIPKDCREPLIRLFLQPREPDGKIALNTKNMPLIYRITQEMARQSGLASRYSAEFIFSHEFTTHYDEFAQYLPEFGRLKELSKITVLVSFLKNLRESNQESLDALEMLINTPFSSPVKITKIYQNFKQIQDKICEHTFAQFREWENVCGSSVLEKKYSTQINQIKKDIGRLTFPISCLEVREQFSASNQQAEDIAKRLTDMAQKNCRKNLHRLFSEYALPSLDTLIDFFIQGNIKPLVNALLTREQKQLEEQLVKLFPKNSSKDLMSALDGSNSALLRISAQKSRDYYEEEKKSCELIELGYSNIGLGKQKEPLDLEGKCFWVPASVHHQAPVSSSRHSFFVYGGVNINPRVNIVQGNGALRGNQLGGVSFNRANITQGFQSHHIASEKNKLTRNHELFKLSGINVNSRVNMIYLPKNPSSHDTRSIHNGRHTNSYSQKVAEEMTRVANRGQSAGWTQQQYRDETRSLLSELRQDLRAGNIGLNKHHRPWATKW